MAFDTLTIVAICLFASFILSELFFRIKYPRVIGQLLAGILLGLPVVRVIFSPDVLTDIQFLADLGIIFLLLLVGMQIRFDRLLEHRKDTLILAMFTTFVPFLFGVVLMKALNYSNTTSFVVGAAFSLTAEGTKSKVLLDLRALNTKAGVIMMGAGIIDDMISVLFISIILVLTQQTLGAVAILPLKFLGFAIIVWVVYKLFPYWLRIVQKERSRVAIFSFVLLFALIIAGISSKLELGPIIGAFVAGIIIHLTEKRKYEYKENIKDLEAMTFAFIIPFFFINIGLNMDFAVLKTNLWLTVMVLIMATAGKLLGSFLATPFTSLTIRQTHLIGWGMNSRGAVELVIAELARVNNLIPIEVYSAIVVMAVVTTLIFPVIMKIIVTGDRSILHDKRPIIAPPTRQPKVGK